MIKRRIEGAVRYPSWARTQGIEGEALVKFIVSSSGKAGEVSILNGTGFKILDDDAVNTIKRAGPFPPFPKDVRGDSAVIELSILYTLNKGSDHWTRPLDEELCNI
jgi:protein TonB